MLSATCRPSHRRPDRTPRAAGSPGITPVPTPQWRSGRCRTPRCHSASASAQRPVIAAVVGGEDLMPRRTVRSCVAGPGTDGGVEGDCRGVIDRHIHRGGPTAEERLTAERPPPPVVRARPVAAWPGCCRIQHRGPRPPASLKCARARGPIDLRRRCPVGRLVATLRVDFFQTE